MKRQRWIDTWKGMLILLVVIGHVVGTAAHLTRGAWSAFFSNLFALIYMFHMPAFFFLAGYLVRSDARFVDFVRKKFFRLIVPYMFFGMLSAVIFIVFNDATHTPGATALGDGYYATLRKADWVTPFLSILHGGGWPNGDGFRCNSVLWFLPCMFLTQMALYGVLRVEKAWGPAFWILGVLTFCVAVVFQASHVGLLPWGVSLVPMYLVSTLIGNLAARYRMADRIAALSPWAAGGGGILLFVGLWGLVITGNFYPLRDYMILRIILSSVGVIASMALAIAMRGRASSILGILGADSLGVMLTHKFIVIAFLVHIPVLRAMCSANGPLPAVPIVIVTLAATILSLVATAVARKCIPWAIGEKRLQTSAGGRA